MIPLPWTLVVTLALLGAAQDPVPGSTEEGDGAESACCHQVTEEPARLSRDASSRLRELRAIYDGRDELRHVFLSPGLVEVMRERCGELSDSKNARRRLAGALTLGQFLVHAGDIEQGIGWLERAVAICEAEPALDETTLTEALYRLGMGYFRLAERQNCIAHHSAESCIFPLEGAAVHVDPRGAERALAVFERVLAIDPEYTEARWLVNVAHMALGSFPNEVPRAHRYPPGRFASEARIGRFEDIAGDLGLARFSRAGGALLEDFDADGRLDVLTSSFDLAQGLELHLNRGLRGFEDVSAAAGLAGQLGGLALVQADVDGDGLLDVYVVRGGELFEAGEMPDSLLRQVRPGVFEDVTDEAGLGRRAPSQCAAFADIDRDGDLDLFVGSESMVIGEGGPERYPSKLYRNKGDGTFEDISTAAGIENRAGCVGAAFGDVDADGLPDLYLSNRLRPNRLYVNKGDGSFEDRAAELGVSEPLFSRATWFFDYDNDGDLDLFVAFHGHVLRERAVARYYLDGRIESDTPRLYENDGEGRFKDVTRERGLERVAYVLGASFGDCDGDGWPDLYLGTGAAEMSALWPNLMLRNDGGKRFQDVTRSAGLGHLQKTNAVAFGDVDCDGDQDLLLQVGGFHLDDGFGDVLFENPGHGNRWLCVELEGRRSNRFGLGARLRVRVRDGKEERDIYAFVGARSSAGGNSLRQEIGLGCASAVLELEVRWPIDGALERFEEVPLDAVVRVREGSGRLERIDRKSFRLR